MAATSTCLGIISTSGLINPSLGSPTSTTSTTRGRIALGSGSRPLLIVAGGGKKKIQTKQPFGPSGGTKFKDGLDASGRKMTGKGVYQFSNKYGANVDGYSPIYDSDDWSPSGDVYVGGTSGLLIWAITLGAILLGGALLVYNTSALAQ